MKLKNLGTSQHALVPVATRNPSSPRKWPQYAAVLTATLGALAAGMVQGWCSPAGDDGARLEYPFALDADDFSWVSSAYTLGAAATCIPGGILVDLVGRRSSMLIAAFPFTAGWACVIWPNSLATLIVGRFLLGLSVGALCVATPIYIGEIADAETRGRLGSCVELNFVLGILVVYALGLLRSMFLLSLVSAAVPIVFLATFFAMPETPTYSLMRGNDAAARKTLVWLRGRDYDVDAELTERTNALAEAKRDETSFLAACRSRATLRALFVGFGLMFFQQLSGINAIIFYGGAMFADATGDAADWPIIVVGVLQVAAVLMSTLVVDKWGRRIPLFVSGAAMCVTSLVLGVYFYLEINDDITVEKWRWLPLVCVCGFVLAIEFGFGPIPWLMMGEIFSARVKGVAGSCVSAFNWLVAFAVTKFYVDVKRHIGAHGAFWAFSIVCGLGVVFAYLAVPETRGKTLEEIQIELGGRRKSVTREDKAQP